LSCAATDATHNVDIRINEATSPSRLWDAEPAGPNRERRRRRNAGSAPRPQGQNSTLEGAHRYGASKLAALVLAFILALVALFGTPTTATAHGPSGGKLRDEVERFYTQGLGRPADQAGRNHWIAIAQSDCRVRLGQDVVVPFFTGTEFLAKNRAMGARIDALYRAVLGREPDAPGRATWLGHLTSGRLTWKEVVWEFTRSPEFVRRTRSVCANDPRAVHMERPRPARLDRQTAERYAQKFAALASEARFYCGAGDVLGNSGNVVLGPYPTLFTASFQMVNGVWAGSDPCQAADVLAQIAGELDRKKRRKPTFTASSRQIQRRFRPDLCEATYRVDSKTYTLRGPIPPGGDC
jgi:hypothetical protein